MNPRQVSENIALRAHLLGPLRLTLNNQAIEENAWARRSSRSLLLLLLITPGHAIPRDRILDLLWPDGTPASASSALYVAVHGLRRMLEPDLKRGRQSTFIEIENEMVRLRADASFWVDVVDFEQMLKAADRQAMPGRLTSLRETLTLYAGDLLVNDPYSEWAIPRREQLRTHWRRAVMETGQLEIETGSPLMGAQLALQILASDPTDEEAFRMLMRSLAAAGRVSDALRQYERCAEVLRDELDTEPATETIELAAEIRSMTVGAPALPRTQEFVYRFETLPAPGNPLVGRNREVGLIEEMLLGPAIRIVTLSGPAGIGKTRLAQELANQLSGEFANGVLFVPLASLLDPDLVIPDIVRAADPDAAPGTNPLVKLAELLQEREMLLVLDNFEQVLDAAPELAELLERCPGLKLLVTSREPLHLRSEHIVDVPPLSVPPAGSCDAPLQATVDAISRYESVELFTQRVRAIHPDFQIDRQDIGSIVQLCRRTDGLPLAIELAAAASRDSSPADIIRALNDDRSTGDDGYRDLPARQRTMHQAIDWSYRLLDPSDQELFRQLAVFVGGSNQEAAAAVARMTTDPVENVASRLTSLVSKSLLYIEEFDTGTRYHMLETIREFGLEALRQNDEVSAVRSRHAEYFLEVAERASPELTGPNQVTWFDRLESDLDNFRAAFNWWRDAGEAESVLRLGVALTRFWLSRGYFQEGRTHIQPALVNKNISLTLRAEALSSAGLLAENQGDSAPAEAFHRQALALWRRLNDRRKIAVACASLANVAQDSGEFQRAIELNEEALPLYREERDAWGIAQVSNNLGSVAYFQGDYQRADGFWTDALAAIRQIGDVRSEGHILNNLAALSFQLHDHARAWNLHEQGLALRRRVGDKQGIASSLVNMSEVSRAEHDLPRAETLAQQAAAIFGEIGDKRLGALAHAHLAIVTRDRGDPAHAYTLALEAVQVFHATRDPYGLSGSMVIMGAILVDLDQPASGIRLIAAADVIRKSIGTAWEPGQLEILDAAVESARARLGDEGLSTEREIGQAMSIEDAIAEILASEAV